MFSILLLLLLVTITHQVDIIIRYQYFMRTVAICPRQQPGICCRAPPIASSEQGRPFPSLAGDAISFQHLLPGDIAAVFQTGYRNSLTYAGCTTNILATRHGPGTFSYTRVHDGRPESGIGGGSFISLGRVQLPPDAQSIGALVFEGVLGLVWGGGQWFASAVAQHRFGSSLPKVRRRGIRSERKGMVYAQPPARWVYPTVIEVHGTNYSDGGMGNLVYKNMYGAALNLTLFDEVAG
ncbi:MAG: hypothetical protein Q9172_004400 [Xanthocarpia lactea]